MGTWGYWSYENDMTMDALLPTYYHGQQFVPGSRQKSTQKPVYTTKTINASLQACNGEKAYDQCFVGVVIFANKHKCSLTSAKCQLTKPIVKDAIMLVNQMLANSADLQKWDDPNKRISMLRQEKELLESLLR